MKNLKLKFILFIQLLGLFATAMAHLIMYFIGVDFNYYFYPAMSITLLAITLFTIFCVTPFLNWFFDL